MKGEALRLFHVKALRAFHIHLATCLNLGVMFLGPSFLSTSVTCRLGGFLDKRMLGGPSWAGRSPAWS